MPVATWSLRTRLLALVLVSTACAWVAGGVVTARAVDHTAERLRDERLVTLCNAVLAFARHELAEASIGQGSDDRPSGLDLRYRYQVWRQGQLLLRSPDAPTDRPLAGTQQPGFFDGRQDGGKVRSHVTAPDPAGLQVQVSQLMDPEEGGILWPEPAMLGLMLLSLAAVGALAVALVMRALRPVAAAEAALRARTPHQLDPIPLDGLPDEMRPLLEAFNDHLGRTAERLSRERGFTALAAHELRTPLSALRMQVQVALRLPDGPARQAQLQSVLASVDRSDHLIHQLLTLARVEQGGGTTSLPVDLRALATGVAEDLALQERQRGVTVAIEGQPVTVRGWSFALSVMLRNLIDNAIAHAPAGSCVRVAMGAGPGGVELCVDDAGPGIPEADRPRSFQRFMRLNDAALRPGVGLGLSIAQAVADAHGAHIELQDAPTLGGLRVRVLFPTEAGRADSPAPAP